MLALAVMLAGAATVAYGLWFADRSGDGPSVPARVIDGIPAPDPGCIHDVQDLGHPWIANGWWAGYVDGQPREMATWQIAALSQQGHDTRGVWLCAPRQ